MFLITILSLSLSLLKWSSLSLLHIPDVERGDRTNLIDPPAKIHPTLRRDPETETVNVSPSRHVTQRAPALELPTVTK